MSFHGIDLVGVLYISRIARQCWCSYREREKENIVRIYDRIIGLFVGDPISAASDLKDSSLRRGMIFRTLSPSSSLFLVEQRLV